MHFLRSLLKERLKFASFDCTLAFFCHSFKTDNVLKLSSLFLSLSVITVNNPNGLLAQILKLLIGCMLTTLSNLKTERVLYFLTYFIYHCRIEKSQTATLPQQDREEENY